MSKAVLGEYFMGYVANTCPNCGANIKIDEINETGVCPYCKTSVYMQEPENSTIFKNSTVNTTVIENATIFSNKQENVSYKVIKIHFSIKIAGDLLVDDKVYARNNNSTLIEVHLEDNCAHRIQFVSAFGGKSNVLFLEKDSEDKDLYYYCASFNNFVLSTTPQSTNTQATEPSFFSKHKKIILIVICLLFGLPLISMLINHIFILMSLWSL